MLRKPGRAKGSLRLKLRLRKHEPDRRLALTSTSAFFRHCRKNLERDRRDYETMDPHRGHRVLYFPRPLQWGQNKGAVRDCRVGRAATQRRTREATV